MESPCAVRAMKKNTRKKCDAREERFAQEYLIDLDPHRAAIDSGYSETIAKSKAFQWVAGGGRSTKPYLFEAIQRAMAERSKRTEITQDMVVQELARIGFADMADFVTIDESGMIQANPLNTLEEGKSRIIRKVREKRVIKSTAEGDQVLDATYEFELCDKVKSLELLGKHLGMFTDKHEVDLKQPINLVIRKFYRGNAPQEGGA